MSFARGVTGGASDDLYDFSQASTVTDSQRMLAPNPIEPFFGHTQRDNDVDVVLICFHLRRAQAGLNTCLMIWIDEISDSEGATIMCFDQLKTSRSVSA